MSGLGWQDEDRALAERRDRLARWLATKLVGATDVRVAALTRPSSNGFSNETLLADLAWREGTAVRDLAAVIRIEPSGETVFPAYDLGAQFRILTALAPTDVPVPRTLWLEEDPSVLGAPFYVMDRIDGRVPTDTPPYHVAGWMTEVAPAERATIWWSGLEALARINRIEVRGRGLDSLGATPPGAAVLARHTDATAPSRDTTLERHLDYYERYVAWAGDGTAHALCETALVWLRAHRPRDPEHIGLCWGDARLGNMIFRDGRCVAVLDWEMAVVGDPEQDLAWWLFFDRHHSEGCGAERLPGLPSRDESIRRYEEWTGRPVRNLAYYEIFAAYRFAAIMIRVARQLVARGILPPDSDFATENTATRLLARMLQEAGAR